jgi:sterol desaturase/sphingolipid hydroxylase (fatty acid hydroxylase superfamily)
MRFVESVGPPAYSLINALRVHGEKVMIPTAIIVIATILFLFAERAFPGRELPEAPGWYARAILLNLTQLGVVVLAGAAWNRLFRNVSLFHVSQVMPAFLQGLLGWFIGTFVFYWWHRARHHFTPLWRVFHQVHHSPARIEMMTSFYKHPVEIIADSILASALLFCLLGASPNGAAWFNVFAVVGEYFYHSNLRTPHWIGYFLQRPEHHSIHHQLDVHEFNYGDITWWDRIFGTFRDADTFAAACGFPENHEANLGRMIAFHDNY